MLTRISLLLAAGLALAACDAPAPTLGPDGKPLPRVYDINDRSFSRIQYRMLDSVNSLRQAAGQTPVTLNPRLNAAAETHSRDMSRQNRPWHFGSDGSSPIERVQRTGYTGRMLGENISETYESELETLAAWMEQSDTRAVVMAPEAREMGFAWHQDPNGKLWWTLLMGSGEGTGVGYVQTDLAARAN